MSVGGREFVGFDLSSLAFWIVPHLSTPKTLSMTFASCRYRLTFFLCTLSILCTISTLSRAQPTITGFSPSSGPVGSTVTITGTQFDATAVNDIVYFGAARAAVSAATATTLTVTVPVGATYQPMTVTAHGLTGYEYKPFGVVFSGAVAPFGTNSFGAPINMYASVGTPQEAKTADIDGDGKPDLVMSTTQDGMLSFLRNTSANGVISFSETDFTAGATIKDFAVGDLDGDGLPDAVIAGTTLGFLVMKNKTSGGVVSFAQGSQLGGFTLLDAAYSVAIADMDGDGKPDIVGISVNSSTSPSTTNFTVYLNTTVGGVISFAHGINLTPGNGSGDIVLNDLDGDGKPDITVLNANDSTLWIYKNNSTSGALAFSAPLSYRTHANPTSLAIGDVDGDGKPELVVGSGWLYNYVSPDVEVYHNTSSGGISFAAFTDYPLTTGAEALAIGDLDGDGKPDLAVSCDNGNTNTWSMNVLRNTGAGFAAPQSYPETWPPYGDLIVDLDGDGLPDIYCTTAYNFMVLKNQVTTSLSNFLVPTIGSFTPVSGGAGSSVTIKGNNFDVTPANNTVFFGPVAAKVTAATTTSLTTTVPAGAPYAQLSVTRNQLLANSHLSFDLTFPGGNVPFSPQTFVQEVLLGSSNQGGGPGGSVVAGDLDGDGLPDLVTNVNGTSVYRNTGTAGASLYATPVTLTNSGWGANAVTLGDVDGDGKKDIIAVSGGGVTVWLNKSTPGNLVFAPGVTNDGGLGVCVATGDIDGDGKLDIVTGNGNTFELYLNQSNNGTVAFNYNSHLLLNGGTIYYGGPMQIAVVDLDGDGKPDVVTSGDEASVTKNLSSKGSPAFGQTVNFASVTGGSPYDLVVGDIDGDGLTDVVVANYFDTTISIFRNPSPEFATATRTDIKTPYEPYGIAIGDLNGDGKPDLAITDINDKSVVVLKNQSTSGTMSFAPYVEYPSLSEAGNLVIADVDGNGLPDIVVTNGIQTQVLTNQLETPLISIVTPTLVDAGSTITITGYNFTGASAVSIGGVPVASFTVVSATEITAVAGEGASGPVTVQTPVGTTTSTALVNFYAPVISAFTPASGAVGSTVTITGSHFSKVPANNIVYFGSVTAQVLSATPTLLTVKVPPGAAYRPITVTTYGNTAWSMLPFVVRFAGIGTMFTPLSFAPHADTLAGDSPQGIAIGDLDGDGKPEIAIPNYNSQTVSILRNAGMDGTIVFNARVPVSAGDAPDFVSMADIDGDGRLDLVIANNAGTVSVLLNTSTGGTISFAPQQFFDVEDDAAHLAIADLDGDGKADIVAVSEAFGQANIYILRNTTAGGVVSFIADGNADDFITGNQVNGVALSDLDGDGKPDLALSYYFNQVLYVLVNTSTRGSISFNISNAVSLPLGGMPWQVVAGDLDGDGKPDLAVGIEQLAGPGGVYLFHNGSTAGSLSFTQQNYLTTDFTPYDVAIGDLDGDGYPDIVAGNMDDDVVSVFRNMRGTNGAPAFSVKADYATGMDTRSVVIGDLDGDGKPDLVVGNFSEGTVSLLRNQIGEPLVTPSGADPVSGNVVKQVFEDSVVQTLNGSPFVPRHYAIQPSNDAANATATVTLYFTQQDFDVFNAYPNHGPDLPHGPNDLADLGNLRIYQYHGFSATNVPGTYGGAGVVITPAASAIVWNAAYQWWEVSFPVTGFSGFFASNGSFNYNQTPAPVITTGDSMHICGSGSVVLLSSASGWGASASGSSGSSGSGSSGSSGLGASADTGFASQWYKDGTAIAGATGFTYTTGDSGVYTVTAAHNGIVSPPSAGVTITVAQIPPQPVITVSANGKTLQSSAGAGNQWFRDSVLVPGATAQTYQPADTAAYTVQVSVSGCVGPMSAPYSLSHASTTSTPSTPDTGVSVRMNPNPSKGLVTLVFANAGATTVSGTTSTSYLAEIVDMYGRVCMRFAGLVNGSQMNLAGLSPGIYTAHILSADGKQEYTARVMIE